jgi:hypothetical protein
MGVDVMRPTFNFEPKYRVTLLNREAWTKGLGAPPEIKGLVWFTDGSKMKEGTGGWSLWTICEKKAQFLPRKISNSFPGRDLGYPGICSCIPDSQLYRITSTKCRINRVVPPDDGPGEVRNM